jgi:hypothetical protein
MVLTYIDSMTRYGREMVEGDLVRPTRGLEGLFRDNFNKILVSLGTG